MGEGIRSNDTNRSKRVRSLYNVVRYDRKDDLSVGSSSDHLAIP